jgi:hypothetical protein
MKKLRLRLLLGIGLAALIAGSAARPPPDIGQLLCGGLRFCLASHSPYENDKHPL